MPTAIFLEVMERLETLGTAQNRKVYARHGVKEPSFGLSYGNLNKLKKQYKKFPELAPELWASGNHDARILACMLADATTLPAATLDVWVQDLDSYVIADAFSSLVKHSPYASEKMLSWIASDEEFIGQVGWSLASFKASDARLSDDFFMPYLKTIKQSIHSQKNRVRYSMVMFLINVGLRSEFLEKEVALIAEHIGTVEVDHGQTGCKTPEVMPYIEKTKAHYAKKASEKLVKSKS